MERKGICKQAGVCSMYNKVQIINDDDAEFKCCECGEELEPYKEEEVTEEQGPKGKGKLIAIICAAVVVIGGIGAFFAMGGESKPTKIVLDKQEIALIVGQKDVLKPTAEPADVKATFTFKAIGKNVEVTSDGEITAVEKGDAAITVKCEENPDLSATCKVTVKEEEAPVVEEPNEEPQEEPKATEPVEKPREKPATPQGRTRGTVSLGYGSYSGDLLDGKPDGAGLLTFSRSYQISDDVTAEKGDKFDGVFQNGKITTGTLTKASGQVIKVRR